MQTDDDAEGPLFQDWLTELGKVAAFERISYSIIYNKHSIIFHKTGVKAIGL